MKKDLAASYTSDNERASKLRNAHQRSLSGGRQPRMSAKGSKGTRHHHNRQAQRQSSMGQGKVAYMCVADAIDLEGIMDVYKALEYQCERQDDVLHVTNVKGYGSTMDDQHIARFDLFVFEYGSIVWWGTDVDTFRFVERDFFLSMHGTALRETRNEISGRYPQNLIDEMFPDWCTFSVSADEGEDPIASGKFLEQLQRDHILLQSDRPAFKQAISHALAQSAKLDIMEPLVADLLNNCKPLPVQVSLRGSADISGVEVNQLKGELFQYRMILREVLDEPDFFWEYSWFEPLYDVVKGDYNLQTRVSLLEDKLTAVQEILDMLSGQFSMEHNWRLEWIVIILIVAAVLIAGGQLYVPVKKLIHPRT